MITETFSSVVLCDIVPTSSIQFTDFQLGGSKIISCTFTKVRCKITLTISLNTYAVTPILSMAKSVKFKT